MKKKKKLNNTDNCLHEYKYLKNSFQNICNDVNIINIFEDLCIRSNSIIKHASYFLKLYLSYLFNINEQFPIINVDFLRYIYTFVSTIKSDRKCLSSNYSIIQFNKNIFSKLNIDKVSRDGLTNILSYESEILVTCLENNIKVNFYKHFSKFINVKYNYLEQRNKIVNEKIKDKEKKDKMKVLNTAFHELKFKILLINEMKNDDNDKLKILKIRKLLFGHINNINDKGVLYDVQIQPQKYLFSFFTIIKYYEKYNKNIKDNEIKLFSVIPQRKTLIPRYITIDTEIIIQNFKTQLKEKIKEIDEKCSSIEDLRKTFKINNLHYKIWNVIFDMKNKYFRAKNKHKFNYLLKTNVVGCSALFKIKEEIKQTHKTANFKLATEAKYIENVVSENKFNILGNKIIVCIDPNKRDLMYCGMKKENKIVTFRYTQCQRRVEVKTKKYTKIRKKLQKESIIKNNKNVKEIELEKTKYNTKSIKLEKIKTYINKYEKIDKLLKEHYEQKIYRKLEWNSYMNKERSESKMIKNFSSKMGNNKETIVIIGDYSVKSSNMKGTLPSISKQIIRIFKKNKFETYLINEYNTSKLCNNCKQELEKFHKRKSKKPKDKGKMIEVHGLLRCPSLTCKIIHNRDKNAVINMLNIMESLKTTQKRPNEYTYNSTKTFPYQ